MITLSPPPEQAEKKHEHLARDQRQAAETLNFRYLRERCCLSRGAVAAFTLAEVLITLGIIGIVAAITIPTLIGNYKKQKNLNILKTAYSDLNKAVVDFNQEYDCAEHLGSCTPNSGEFVWKFTNFLHDKKNYKSLYEVAPYYPDRNVWVKPKLLNNPNQLYTQWMIKKTEVPFSKEQGSAAVPHWLISPNGTYIFAIGVNMYDNYYTIDGKTPANQRYIRAFILIATNTSTLTKVGLDYQNNTDLTLGKDLFEAFIVNNLRVVPNGSELCSNGGYYCSYWKKGNTCNQEQTSVSNGRGCLSRIIEDGWQIKYY